MLPFNYRPNPFVGPRPIEQGEPFFGRKRELDRMLDLLIAERIVLLHSPSGAGKTSLIKAGLIPRLLSEGFEVLPVARPSAPPSIDIDLSDNKGARSKTKLPGNRYLLNLLGWFDEDLPEPGKSGAASLANLSLAEYLEKWPRQVDENGKTRPLVLIIDQFEEIITLDPTDKDGKSFFFELLGQALYEPRLWALFAMREDFVAALDPYLRPVPTRLNVHYRLDLLDQSAARQAIQEPARLAGVTFHDEAVVRLVDDLRRVQVQQPDGSLAPALGDYIEPVQLQVVCRRLWFRLGVNNEVSLRFVEAIGDVNSSLGDYYASVVEESAQKCRIPERRIRDWIQNVLITEGKARSQALMGAETSQGLENTAVRRLVDGHLVRAEKRRGLTWFELAHDRLVEPILANNLSWFAANLRLLQQQAPVWDSAGRKDELLILGETLAGEANWAKEHPDELTDLERAFLESCFEYEQRQTERHQQEARELQMAQELAEAQSRAAQRFRRVASILGFVLICALILGLVVVFQGRSLEAISVTAQANQTSAAQIQLTALSDRKLAQAEQENSLAIAATADAAVRMSQSQAATASALEVLAREQEKQAIQARADLLSAQAEDVREAFPQLSLLLHIEAVKLPSSLGLAPARSLVQSFVNTLEQVGGIPLPVDDSTDLEYAVSQDGHWLATGGASGVIQLWNMRQVDPLGPITLSGNIGAVKVLVISPDSHWLVSASDDLNLRIWDLEAMETDLEPAFQEIQENPISKLAISPDNRYLVSADAYGWIYLWNFPSQAGKLERLSLGWYQEPIHDLEFSPDSQWLAVAATSVDGILFRLDESPIQPRWLKPTSRYVTESSAAFLDLRTEYQVDEIIFSPDSHWLATRNLYAWGRLWDLTQSKPEYHPYDFPTVVGREITSLKFSPDGRWMITVWGDHQARLWYMLRNNPLSAPVLLGGEDSRYYLVDFSHDSHWLAIGDTNQNIKLWDVSQINPGRTPFVIETEADELDTLVFQPDGDWLAAGLIDGSIRMWKILASRVEGEEEWPLPNQVLHGHDQWINQLIFIKGTNWLLSDDGVQLRVWDLSGWMEKWYDGTVLSSLQQFIVDQPGKINKIALSPDGAWLASVSNGEFNEADALVISGTVHLADLKSFNWQGSDIVHSPYMIAGDLGFSPDSRWLANHVGESILVDLQLVRGNWADIESSIVKQFSVWLHMSDFANDSQRFISATSSALFIYRIASNVEWTQQSRWEFDEKPGFMDITVSQDGKWLAAGGRDGFRLWDIRRPYPVSQPTLIFGHTSRFRRVAFNKDGRWLVGLSDGEELLLLDLAQENPTQNPFILKDYIDYLISPDGRWLVAKGSEISGASLRVWDLSQADFEPGEYISLMDCGTAGSCGVPNLAFSTDSQRLYVPVDGHYLLLFDLSTASPGSFIEPELELSPEPVGSITRLAIHPDGRHLVVGDYFGTVWLWSVDLGDWIDLACRTAGRNLTQDEWQVYFPGQAYRETCGK